MAERTLIPQCGLSKLGRSPGKVHGRVLLYSQQTAVVVVCNLYLWSERSGDLPDF